MLGSALLSVRSFARFFAVSVWRHEIWLLLDRHVDSGIVAVSEVVCTSGCFSGGAQRHAPGRFLVTSKFFAFRQLTFRVEHSTLWLALGQFSLATELGKSGSSLSVFGVSKLGSSLSVMDFFSLLRLSLSRSSPDLERSSVCQDFRWPFEGASMAVLASFGSSLSV